jgi:hypothetical protein
VPSYRESGGGSGLVVFTLPSNASVEFSAGVTVGTQPSGDRIIYTVTSTSTTSETVTIS